MNAAVVHSFETTPRYDSFADPVAAEDEAMVTVTAVGLHQIVRALARGTHYGSAGVLPFIPGVDGVGRLEDGTRVYFGAARSPFGSFAERSITSRAFSFPLSDALDDATAAGIANPGMSSRAALKLRGHPRPFRKKVCNTRRRAFAICRWARRRVRKYRCPPRRCAVPDWSCWAAALAVSLWN